MELEYTWYVEDSEGNILFTGKNKIKALSFYKKNGGMRAGLHFSYVINYHKQYQLLFLRNLS